MHRIVPLRPPIGRRTGKREDAVGTEFAATAGGDDERGGLWRRQGGGGVRAEVEEEEEEGVDGEKG